MKRPRSCHLCGRKFKPKTDKHWAVVRRVHEHSFRHLRAAQKPA